MANGFNPYAYQDKFAGAGDAAAAAVAENEARRKAFLDEEDRDLKRQMTQLQFGEMKAKQAEALVVPGDTGFNNVDIAVNQASRQLVDQAGALTAQLNKGEISVDDWASQTALIRSQVPGVKQWKETLNTNLGQYTQALANGQLSDAMDPSAFDLYGTLIKDDGRLNLAVNDQGQVMFEGSTEGGEEVSIPVNGAANMPKPILKQPSPYETMKEPLKEFNNQPWSDDIGEFAATQLDAVLAKGGEPALLSLAVDHMGIPYNEAKQLASMEADGYTSALEQQVEGQWIQDAKSIHVADQIKTEKEQLYNANLELRNKQLQDQINNGQSPGGATAAQKNFAAEQDRAYKRAQGLAKQFVDFGTPTDEKSAAGLARALSTFAPQGWNFAYEPASKPGRLWGTNDDWSQPGIMYAQDAKGNEVQIDLSNPEQVQQWIRKISGIQ